MSIGFIGVNKQDVEDILSLTPMQEGLLFHYLNNSEDKFYFEQLSLQLSGKIDVEMVKNSWQYVIANNEVLRTVFRWEKLQRPIQIVLKRINLPIQIFDLTTTDQDDKEKKIEEIKKRDAQKKIDIRTEPFRITFIKITSNKGIMLITNHHILYDGWSIGIILKEFFQTYNLLLSGKEPQRSKKNSFKEFVQWLRNQNLEEKMKYWEKYLKGFDTKTQLPSPGERETIEFDRENYELILDTNITAKINGFAKEHKITLATLLYTVWGILLQKYNNNDDILFGTTVSGRNAKLAGIEDIVGLFINTIPLRVKSDQNQTVINLLKDIDSILKERTAYENVSLVDIQSCTDIDQKTGLFDSLVVIENYPLDKMFKEDNVLQVESYSISESTTYDITLIIKSDECISILFDYNPQRFDKQVIGRLSKHFFNLFKSILENPAQKVMEIEMLTEEERQLISGDFNNTTASYPKDKTIDQLFEEQVMRSPDAVAVVYQDKEVTYRELNQKVKSLARVLREQNVGPETIVGILIERSLEMLVGILAILKVGGAYLPITPDYPRDRIKYILEDSGTEILLSRNRYFEKVDFTGTTIDLDDDKLYSCPAEDMSNNNSPGNLAYVIYTSGSTGNPKGVLVEHQSVVNILTNLEGDYPLVEDDTYLLKTTFTFDVSVTELFGWFVGSGRVAILPPGGEKDIDIIIHTISNYKVTHINFVPSMLSTFLDGIDDYGKLSSLKYIFVAGEAFTLDLGRRCREQLENIRVENIYGPTEATIYTVRFSLKDLGERASVPIGKPLNNAKAYILSKNKKLLPIGVTGELYLSGDCLARGYLNRDDLTAERFIDNPFTPGERLYRTGDLARWLSDGNIDYRGRVDHQVKIRGYRIEPGEIENQLLKYEVIKEAIVIDQQDQNGDKYLCAYIVKKEGDSKTEISAGELRRFLLNSLPDYMIPSHFVQLEKMPLNSSGKIDRKALPAPEGNVIGAEYEPPQNQTEETLVKIWEEILNIKQVGRNDNFFELGGHSLKATLLISQIHKQFDVQIAINQIFKRPTIKELSQLILKSKERTYTAIEKAEEKEYYQTWSPQQRMYMLQQLDLESTGYNISGVLEIEGKLDLEKVESTLFKLITRHESLRTSFKLIEETVVQQIHKEVEFGIEYLENTGNPDRIIKEFIRPFDLSKAPLMRVGILVLTDERYLLILDMHHIISDGQTLRILINEFAALYQGKELEEIKIQYKDFAEWQNKLLQSEELKKHEEYWLNLFSGQIPILNLPTDYPRSSSKSSAGDMINFTLDENLTIELKRIADETNSTVYMVLLSAINILLSRYSGQEDIIIGSPIAGRSHVDLDKIVGLFVNTLALRNYPKGDKTYKEFIKEVRENALKAYDHQDYQFEELVNKLGVERDLSRNPVFDVIFGIQDIDLKVLNTEDLKISKYDYSNIASQFDLTFLASTDETIAFQLQYNTNLFKKETINRLRVHFVNILKNITDDLEIKLKDIDILSREERDKILYQFNDTYKKYPKDKTLIHLFEEVVEKRSTHKALIFNNRSMSYSELNTKVNQLARSLRENGVKRNQPVSIMLNKSFELIIGVFAILKAGGAYVPIDPTNPAERIAYILEDSNSQILLTHSEVSVKISKDCNVKIIQLEQKEMIQSEDSNLEIINEPDDLAYIIYTSGTTGKPKGTLIKHYNVINLVKSNSFRKVEEDDKVLQLSNFSFDASVYDIFASLLNGATLVLVDKETAVDMEGLARLILEEKITQFLITTALFNILIDSLEDRCIDVFRTVKKILFGGESASPLHVGKAFAYLGRERLVNLYGPTESTVVATHYPINEIGEINNSVPIGKPITNTKVYVVDKNTKLQPIGIWGELCISGEGVGNGYLNRPDLTLEKFIPDPFGGGEILYRTGDLARWSEDGNLEFGGRIDKQVQIRGYRIELKEIESILLSHNLVKEGVVTDLTDEEGNRYLAAYFVSDEELNETQLQEYLGQTLPQYMIPAYIIQLPQLPLTENGKVNFKNLPKPELSELKREYIKPRNELEERIANLVEEVLKIEQVGINDNFFHLGGHSLKATILSGKLYRELGVRVPLEVIFKNPTIKGMSEYIEKAEKIPYKRIEKVKKKEYYETSSAQKRMFILQQRELNSTKYNIPIILSIQGQLNLEQLQKTLKALIKRHETLRTSFATIDGKIVQKINEDIEFELEYLVGENQSKEEVIKQFIRPFDLTKTPLFRVGILTLDEEKCVLIFDIHHIISDGVSMGILVDEFVSLYEGRELPSLKLQYKDYSEWQNAQLESDRILVQKEYWLNRFSGQLPVLDLPLDYPRPTVESFSGDSINFKVSKRIKEGLNKLAKETDSTLYMILMSAINILLAKYSGEEDIIIGSPTTGRTHPDLEKLIGMFVNTLAIRNRPEGNRKYLEFLREVKSSALEAFENQDYQFEELVEQLNLQSNYHRNPLFDVMFVMQNFENRELLLRDLKIRQEAYFTNTAKFDLTFTAQERKDELIFDLEYNTGIFKRSTIERMIKHFLNILDTLTNDKEIRLGEIELCTKEEKARILSEFNDTAVDYPSDKTIHQLFEEQAAKNPDKIAVVHENICLTYKELNQRANRLARILQGSGVKEEKLVGLAAERSVETIVGILAILKAGGAYVPIDPEYPAERISYILEDSSCQVLLTQTWLKERIPADFKGEILYLDSVLKAILKTAPGAGETDNLEQIASPDNLCYVIYTSGSTGKPKGVLVENRGLTNYVWWAKEYYCQDCEGNFPLYSSLSFDLTVTSIFVPLVKGSTIYIIGNEGGNLISEAIKQENVNIAKLTPAHLALIKDEDNSHSSVKKFILGGEDLKSELAKAAIDSFGGNLEIYNEYGPTETVVGCSVYKYNPEDKQSSVLIGKPIANTQLYILDKYLKPVPPGVVGEIYISGDGVARGYLNRPELTSEKFMDNPYIPDKRMYKSGDLGRYLPDGNIEFLGRVDNQVKIRGYRIEIGEVEAHFLKHPDIKEGVVDVKTDDSGNKYLIGYFVSEKNLTVGELRSYLLKQIPEYMVPTTFIQLNEIPLTSNGKVDRRALPEPLGNVNTGVDFAAPRNKMEETIAAVWAEVLGYERVGINDNFFELGGHSLKATVLANKIHKELNVEIQLAEIFKHPTVKEMAEFIANTEKAEFSVIEPVEKREYYPASPAQQRLYFQSQFEDVGLTYNMPVALRIEGNLDINRLEKIFRKLIQRHETLRTSFEIIEGQVVQKIANTVDFHLNRIARQDNLQDIQNEFVQPFDLKSSPLLRVGLAELSDGQQVLLFDMHHIISDGQSMDILIKDFVRLYQGQSLDQLQLQYKDYSVWQIKMLETDRMKKQEEFWLNHFKDQIPVLNLHTDYPRPSVQSYQGDMVEFEVDEEITAGLKEMINKTGSTMYMELLTVYYLLLYKYTNQQDMVIGSPIAGRRHADLEKIIGMFVNMLPIRSRPTGSKRFIDFLREVKENTLMAYDNQDFQFEKLVEKLNLKRDLSRNPLFDVVFSFLESGEKKIEITGLKLLPYDLKYQIAKYDLTLDAYELDNKIRFSFEYCTELFKRETIVRMSKHYLNLLGEVVKNPELTLADFQMLSRAEKDQILNGFNNTRADFPEEKTIGQIFEERVKLNPESLALVSGDTELTYKELNKAANQLARLFRKNGITRETIVGIMAERSIEMIVGMLAVLKAGGAYLPIDSDYPTERIKYMIEDSKLTVLLTDKIDFKTINFTGRIISLKDENNYYEADTNPENINEPSDLAYVIYTSGSTGIPKGVMVEHRSVVNLSEFYQRLFDLGVDQKVIHMANVSFDASVGEIFPSLLNGATVHIITKEQALDHKQFRQYVEDKEITIAHFVPLTLKEHLAGKEKLRSLTKVLVGGDKLNDSLKDQIIDLGYRLTNHYGPTEGTVDAVVARTEKGKSTIGKPIPNTRVYILDGDNKLAPIGVPGELCIAGVGVARGYLNRPELTRNKFVENPLIPGEIIYRTGDLAAWLSDGSIEFIGRIDNQVKIRGYRIEPGEIEAQILKDKKIKDAVVVDKVDSNGVKYLVAYLVIDSEDFNQNELKTNLSRRLPDYMIPAYFIPIRELPITPNGKLDLAALPEPEGNLGTGTAYAGPTNKTEKILTEIWQEVLEIKGIGIDQKFFEVGGHSLKAISLIAKIHKELSVEVPLSIILKNPSIRELAEYIRNLTEEEYIPIQPIEEMEYYPLSSAQKRIYLHHQIIADSSYNMPTALLLEGDLELDRLKRALKQLTERHETLRTYFEVIDDQIVQKIMTDVDIDVTYMEAEEKDLDQLIKEFIRPFLLDKPPLIRVALVKLALNRHLMLFDMHHIISDGISTTILIREFSKMYRGEDLPELKVQYKDYAIWHNSFLQSEKIEKLRAYWIKQLDNYAWTELPARKISSKGEGVRRQIELGKSITEKINMYCQKENITRSTFILTVFNIILKKKLNQNQITVGIPVAGRGREELENIIGVFLNVLVLCSKIPHNTVFKEYLHNLKDQLLKAQEYQDYPYEYLYEDAKKVLNLNKDSLFSIMYNYIPYHQDDELYLDGIRITPYPFEDVYPKYSLTLYVNDRRDTILLGAVFKSDLKEEMVENILESFEKIIEVIVNDEDILIDDIRLTGVDKLDQFLEEFSVEFDDLDF